MKKIPFLLCTPFLFNTAFATPQPDGVRTEIRPTLHTAKPESIDGDKEPQFAKNAPKQTAYSLAKLKAQPHLAQPLLVQAIYARDTNAIETLLAIYRTSNNPDHLLIRFAEAKLAALAENYADAITQYRSMLAENAQLNPVRIELAIALFQQKQDNAAKKQFEQARSAENLPEPVLQLIEAYLQALSQRSGWKMAFSANYLRETNVNNVANQREIENTGFIKNSDMLPQKAHGFAYNFNLMRDFNLVNSHYFAFENDFMGKSYWDNHAYDDHSNRTAIGWRIKTAKNHFGLLPFYEKRWYGGEKYRWATGIRTNFSHWFNPRWQLSTAIELSKTRYFASSAQNGNSQLFSTTLLWLQNPQRFFYTGIDFLTERTQVRQYASDLKSWRIGWGQEWGAGISTRLGLSLSQRQFKDIAKLGGILSLGKIRQDTIYSANLQLWKRDWHWLGITPKLQYSWRKQVSNIPSMYSYIDKNLNLIFEKTF